MFLLEAHFTFVDFILKFHSEINGIMGVNLILKFIQLLELQSKGVKKTFVHMSVAKLALLHKHAVNCLF